jgi:hypothetical protein
MRGKAIVWLISLLLMGCAVADAGNSRYVVLPLQPNNCGTPDQFKPCVRPRGVGIGVVKPTVAIQVLDAPQY